MTKTCRISVEALDAVKAAGYVDPNRAHHPLEEEKKAVAHSILGREIFLNQDEAGIIEVQVGLELINEFNRNHGLYHKLVASMEAIHPSNSPEISVEDHRRQSEELEAQIQPIRQALYFLEGVLVNVVQAQV